MLVGLAIRALIHRRVCFVCTDADAVKRAILLVSAMVHTIVHRAFNAVVRCRTCHFSEPPQMVSVVFFPKEREVFLNNISIFFLFLRSRLSRIGAGGYDSLSLSFIFPCVYIVISMLIIHRRNISYIRAHHQHRLSEIQSYMRHIRLKQLLQ